MEGHFVPNHEILLSSPHVCHLYHFFSASGVRFIFRIVAAVWNWFDTTIALSCKPSRRLSEDNSHSGQSDSGTIGIEQQNPTFIVTLPSQDVDLKQDTSSIHIEAIRKPRRRALLIGIPQESDQDRDEDCHRDVTAIRGLLEDVYDYSPEDIITLIESDERDDLLPTRENIISHIKNLVKDARENDRFFFYFSGHSGQEDTEDFREEDKKNECIFTSDGKKVIDDELRELLVNPLPPSCYLTAIIDSCHSCTMLDLPHYRCNRVYVPWVNRGVRRTDITWESNHRKLEEVSSDMQSLSSSSLVVPRSISSLSNSYNTIQQRPQRRTPQRKPSLFVNTESRFFPDPLPDEKPFGRFMDSPIPMFCSGFCRNTNARELSIENGDPKPHVICLSSCKDDQLTWRKPGVDSMTQILVSMLKENRQRTLEEVLTHLNHALHDIYLSLHDSSKKYKAKMKRCNTKRASRDEEPLPVELVEMHNFQCPQISSFHPLGMKTIFQA